MSEVINLFSNFDVSKAISECIDNQHSQYTVDDCAEIIREEVSESLIDPSIRNDAAMEISRKLVLAEITKRKGLPFYKNGQIDFISFQQLVISISHGVYINVRNANIDALLSKAKEQEKNIQEAIAKRDQYSEAVAPIIEYMRAHDIDTAGEALHLMGN